MKKDYQKALKKWTLFFLSNLVPFNGQSYQKQKGSGTSHQSFFTKQVQKKFFNCYILSDQVWWCNVQQFLSYSKNYISKFIPLPSVLLNLENVERKEKLQKCGFLENEKSFLDEIKFFFFAVFEGLSFDEKIKNW